MNLFDIIIIFCEWIDWVVQNTFGLFMPDLLASFSVSLLIYTLATYLSKKNHSVVKWILIAIYDIYMLYKIYIWQIAKLLNVINGLTTILLIFLFIVYPIGLLFAGKYFKEVRLFDVQILNYHTLFIVYAIIAVYFAITDPRAISLEFCLIYVVFCYSINYLFGGNDKIAS